MIEKSRTERSPRNIVAGVVSLVPFFVIVVSWVVWRDRLPDSLPTQWSGDHIVSTQPTILFAAITAATALVAGSFALIAGFAPIEQYSSRLTFLVTGILAGISVLGWTISAQLALSAAPGSSPVIGAWGLLAIIAPAYGLIPFFTARKPSEGQSGERPELLAISKDEATAWSRTMTVPAFAWLAVGMFGIGTVSLWVPLFSGTPNAMTVTAAVLLVIVVIMSASMSRVRVTADRRGLRVSPRIAPFMVKSIRLSEIEDVRVEQLNPGSWGGWGYRFLPGRSAVILRAGEGVVLDLKNGKEFALTVDDSSGVASVLASLSATPHGNA